MSAPGQIARTIAARARASHAAAAVDRLLARAAGERTRVVVGPWHSEIGFELLYWIPLLNWALARHGIASEQVTAISRGGAESWYARIADSYVDLLDLRSQEQLQALQGVRVRELGAQKQFDVLGSERELVAEAIGGDPRGVMILHPAAMYRLFRGFWSRRCSLALIEDHTAHRPLSPGPALERLTGLPDSYLAVKAYFSDCFPDTEANRSRVTELIATLTESIPVVLLDTGLRIDDHRDVDAPSNGRVLSARELMSPRDNLAVQTRIIANSEGLVGTYGGFSYLGPYLGVPSVGFYSEDNFNHAHLEVMASAARELAAGGTAVPFEALNTSELSSLAPLDALLGRHHVDG